MMFARWGSELRAGTNTLPLFDVERSNKMGGDPYIRYFHSYWAVEPGQALLIEAVPPPAVDTWNFQLNNHWMESLGRPPPQPHTPPPFPIGTHCVAVALRALCDDSAKGSVQTIATSRST